MLKFLPTNCYNNKGENIVHGSDSAENGKIEVAFFFAESELV